MLIINFNVSDNFDLTAERSSGLLHVSFKGDAF